jgi:hypothetical protein
MVKLNEVVEAFLLPATGDQTLSLANFAGKNGEGKLHLNNLKRWYNRPYVINRLLK